MKPDKHLARLALLFLGFVKVLAHIWDAFFCSTPLLSVDYATSV